MKSPNTQNGTIVRVMKADRRAAQDHCLRQTAPLFPVPANPKRILLTPAYVKEATKLGEFKITQAGVRLATILNHAPSFETDAIKPAPSRFYRSFILINERNI